MKAAVFTHGSMHSVTDRNFGQEGKVSDKQIHYEAKGTNENSESCLLSDGIGLQLDGPGGRY